MVKKSAEESEDAERTEWSGYLLRKKARRLSSLTAQNKEEHGKHLVILDDRQLAHRRASETLILCMTAGLGVATRSGARSSGKGSPSSINHSK
jgi:hypothetical protein